MYSFSKSLEGGSKTSFLSFGLACMLVHTHAILEQITELQIEEEGNTVETELLWNVSGRFGNFVGP